MSYSSFKDDKNTEIPIKVKIYTKEDTKNFDYVTLTSKFIFKYRQWCL